MGVEWVEWPEADAATGWDQALAGLANVTIFQAYAWGEYKRRHGWLVRRGTIAIDGTAVAMVQCLVREVRAARVAVVWIPGGPAGATAGLFRLGDVLRRRYRGWFLLLRANIGAEQWPGYDADMVGAGWSPARTQLREPLTFWLDLTAEAAALQKNLTANWRHNLTRGDDRGGRVVDWDASAPFEPLYAVYREIGRMKGIREDFSLADLYALRGLFGSAFVLAASVAEDGQPLAMRGFARIHQRAHDLIAGVSMAGRRCYANYVLTWRLLHMARDRGVQLYDLGGADRTRAQGVYSFKKGLGGRPVALLGEWEWHNSRLLRWAVDRVIAHRDARATTPAPTWA